MFGWKVPRVVSALQLAAVLVMMWPNDTDCLHGWGDLSQMGAPGMDGRPGYLVKHPYMHGGFDRDHLDEQIHMELLSPEDCARGAPRTELQAFMEKFQSRVPAVRCMGLPEKARRAVWIAGAWEHGFREMMRIRKERKEFEDVMQTDAVRAEGERREAMVEEILQKERIIDLHGNKTKTDMRGVAPWGSAMDKTGEKGPYLIRYSEGLYWNITGECWYDCRRPRCPGKEAHPQPPDSAVFGRA